MDYFDILKEAWGVTWRNKILWVLGFFAAASGSGGSGNFNTSSWQSGPSSAEFDSAMQWFESNIALIAVILFALVLLFLVFFVLSIAARGGLISEVQAVREGEMPSLKRGWGTGFRYWGRVFLIGFLLALPFIVVGLLIAGLITVAIISSSSGGDVGAAASVPFFCMIPLLLLFFIPLAIVVSILMELALRYGVLHDMRSMDSIRAAWEALKGKRGAFVFWLVMLIPGIIYAVAVGITALVVAVPSILLVISGAWAVGLTLIVLLGLLLMIPGAAYGTFVSAAWTIFFRRMTGAEKVTPVAAVPTGYIPPPPASPMPDIRVDVTEPPEVGQE